MTPSYKQICALLAAAKIKERDILEFVNALNQLGPDEFIHTVLSMRKALEETSQSRLDDAMPDLYEGIDSSYDTADKITKLLIYEAALPKTLAIQLLTNALIDRHPNIFIPSESRKGFETWLRKLVGITSESELLHIATKIRNDFVHDRPSDWRLR